MTTARRLYFYSLALISVEVFIWGVVGLLRTIASANFLGGNSLLATGLSLVLVGLPIFLIHWRIVQRDAVIDPVERSSRIRAFFLYAILSGLFAAILYAVVALLNRALVDLLGASEAAAWFGNNRPPIDHGIAILVNGVVLVYFGRVLRRDWLGNLSENFLPEMLQLYRYAWSLIGLTLIVSGVYNLIRYLLSIPNQNIQQTTPFLAGGIALLVVGIPLWAGHWWAIQESLHEQNEKRSVLRLAVLYLVSLAGVTGVLATLGAVLNDLIRLLAGQTMSFRAFIQENSAEIGALIPLALMWTYYARVLTRELSGI